MAMVCKRTNNAHQPVVRVFHRAIVRLIQSTTNVYVQIVYCQLKNPISVQ